VTGDEREGAIRVLRESYARGELNSEELDERLEAVFSAHTDDELRSQLPPAYAEGDLPAAATVSTDDADAVERQLSAGEHVEWIGKPDPRTHFHRSDVFLVPFSLVFGTFSIIIALSGRFPGGLVVLPFLGVGAYLIFGRFIYAARRRRRTVYAVTNRRVIAIVRGGTGDSVDATYLRSIPNVSTSGATKGRGDVSFGFPAPGAPRNSGLDPFGPSRSTGGVTFYDIDAPSTVADLVERLREAEHV
jgi:hypothetical protein